ncbi:MAG: cysteine desulfurase family protein [Thermoactinomyces sp.]
MIYLDNSATTQTDPEVAEVMADVMTKVFGNPSSLHGLGVKAERLITGARKVIAQALQVSPEEIFFTSGGTEANNLAIRGVAEEYASRGKHLITTKIEHPSVYDVFQYLERKGWNVTYLPVDQQGRINPDDVERAITDETVLVSIMHVNNEVGTIQPIEEIGRRLGRYPKVLFHVDAVQSFGKIPLLPRQAKIDFLSASGHKLHGPKGIGCLYIRKNLHLPPLLIGGGQEQGIRSGTENVPGIAGMAKAVVLAQQKGQTFLHDCYRWKESFLRQVQAELPSVIVNGDVSKEGGAPYIINLSFPGLKSEVIVHALEKEGVYVSSKSACSSKKEMPSRVLKALGRTDEEALGSIRISMGRMNTENDVKRCAEALGKVIPMLQQVMKVHNR